MAISQSLVFQNGSTADADTYDTESWTPEPNVVYLIFMVNRRGGAVVNYIVPSGNNLTWTKVNEKRNGAAGNTSGVGVYWGIGASPTTGVITLTSAGSTAMGWVVVKVTNVNKTTPIVQSNIVEDASSPYTVSLSAFADAVNNAAVAVFSGLSSGAYTKEASYSELCNAVIVDGLDTLVEYLIGQDTSVTATNGTDFVNEIVAFELKYTEDNSFKIYNII